MIYAVLLAFGDSLTYGARDEYGKSWPQYLAEMYWERHKQPLLYANEGVNGETIADACRRIYPLLLRYREAREVTFFEGTNDAKPEVKTPIVEYHKSLMYIVNACKALDRTVFLATLPGLRGFGSQEYDRTSSAWISEYNKAIVDVAEEFDCPLVDLRSMRRYTHRYVDGCHMSVAGNRYIAGKFYRAIVGRRKLK